MEISTHETLWLQSDGAKMLKDLGIKQADHVIDFGCGQGRYSIPLSQVVGKDGCIYSIERDKKSMADCQARLPLFSKIDAVKFLEIDNLITSNIIPEKSIDAFFTFDVLQFIDDWDPLFAYFLKVLKPKALVCIYPAAIPHPDKVDIDLAIAKMKAIGFEYTGAKTYHMMHNVDMVDDTVYSFRLK